MSYDIYLMMDTGGPEHAVVSGDMNHTSNTVPMWTKALGFPLADMEGRLGRDCIADLERATSHMRHPDTIQEYWLLNPSNGWGNV